jgi:hypothetical protein
MPRRRTPSVPVLPWFTLALRTGEMLAASGQVIPIRLARMAAAGHAPSARDRREFARMGPEKLQAGTQSLFAVALRLQAMQLQWLAQAWRPWLGAWGGWTAGSAHAARLGSAALAPVHRAATANARRLTRVTASKRAVRG